MLDPADQETVRHAQLGDRAALEALWLRHRGWVASVLRAHRPRAEDVEDLVQEVAVRFVGGVRTLGDPAAFGAWLRTVAVNVARSAGRRASLRRDAGDTALADVPDTDAAVRDDARHRLDATWNALDRLDADHREALLLKSVHGFSQVEIAATLGLTVTAVESRLARARRTLRRVLADAEQPRTLDTRPVRRAHG